MFLPPASVGHPPPQKKKLKSGSFWFGVGSASFQYISFIYFIVWKLNKRTFVYWFFSKPDKFIKTE